ncbi:MAG: tRNA (adenosine(37)-N6)-threonylcarbamoyltransferase complex dimerization subunit type 1 TsaB [Candidatus Korobacteraceae bacterium]
MYLLAVDTSGRQGSVALCRGDGKSFETLGLCVLEGGTYSARLIPCIAGLLEQANLAKSQLDGLVVVDGPGSFTGLRVGLSTVKALAEVLDKPLAAVSMLEALAVEHGHGNETVTTVLDAGRGELYVGEYEVRDNRARLVQQSIEKADDFLKRIAVKSKLITTFARLAESSVILVDPLQADAIARVGLSKLLADEVVDPATLDANYIRRSDAELFSQAKR